MLNFRYQYMVVFCFLLLSIDVYAEVKDPFKYNFYDTSVSFEKEKGKLVAVYTIQFEIEALDASNLNFVKQIHYDSRSDIDKVTKGVSSKKLKRVNFITSDAEQDGIFHSDLRIGYLEHKFSRKGETIQFEYMMVYSDLRFLPPVYLQQEYSCSESVATFIDSKYIEYNLRPYHISETAITRENEERTVISFNQLAFSNEDGAPSIGYYAPHVFIIPNKLTSDEVTADFVSSIDDLYKNYKLFTSQTNKDNSKIEEIAKKISDSGEDNIKSTLYWVEDNIRYIAFEYDLMGFIPEGADKVLENKYGDCKGMANLMKEILVQLGYDARLVWIGTHDKAYDYTLPSFYVDNHMICAVLSQSDTIYLDGTESYGDLRKYASRISGRPVMIEDGDSYIISRLPENKLEEHSRKIVAKGEIVDNQIVLDGVLQSEGNYNTQLKQMYYNVGHKKQEWLINNYVRSHKDEVVEIKQSNIDVRDTIGEISYKSRISNAITELQNQLFFSPDINGILFSSDLKSERKVPYKFSRIHNSSLEYTIAVPTGYNVEYLPKSIDISNAFFDVQIELKNVNNTINYTKIFKTKSRLMPPSLFEQWNSAVKQMETFFNDQIILTKL